MIHIGHILTRLLRWGVLGVLFDREPTATESPLQSNSRGRLPMITSPRSELSQNKVPTFSDTATYPNPGFHTRRSGESKGMTILPLGLDVVHSELTRARR